MNKSLKIKKKNKIQELIKQARQHSTAGQLKEACGLFNESLKIAEQYYPDRNHIENMRIKEAIADVKYAGRHYDGALEIYSHIIGYTDSKESTFLEIIRRKEEATLDKLKNRNDDKSKIVKSKVKDLVRKAEWYIKTAEYKKAESCLLEAKRSSKMLFELHHGHYVKIKELHAFIYLQTGEEEKANEIYQSLKNKYNADHEKKK